ncbi:MAG TPA: hypothetical protein VF721_11145 [Pyrinomonadaceae bacterium]|jgi:hypothetical protein
MAFQNDLISEILHKLEYTEYKVLFGEDLASFQQLVNDYIKDGWRCQGGVCYTPEEEGMISGFMQAMVR